MRALRIALLALISLSVIDASSAFARGNGAAGGTSGGATGGTSGGSTGGTGGAGVGSTPLAYVNSENGGHHRFRVRVVRSEVFSSCFKQDQLFDRYGNAVVNLHGAECFQ